VLICDDAEVIRAHRGVGRAVRPSVFYDDFGGMLFGAIVVAKPDEAARSVEDPFCVVEHEVGVRGGLGPAYGRASRRGGLWTTTGGRVGERGHGLDIVREIASDWGRDGDPVTGWVVWFRLDWPAIDAASGTKVARNGRQAS
jgi:hypothetical protein